MNTTEPKTLTFSACWSDRLGIAIRQRANELCPDGFDMHIKNQKEYRAIALAWNMGIDPYLEAITEQSTGGSDGIFVIHPDELHVLVRRLMEQEPFDDEDLERENSAAESLASGICSVLGIELI